jgi:hypothetical protein
MFSAVSLAQDRRSHKVLHQSSPCVLPHLFAIALLLGRVDACFSVLDGGFHPATDEYFPPTNRSDGGQELA